MRRMAGRVDRLNVETFRLIWAVRDMAALLTLIAEAECSPLWDVLHAKRFLEAFRASVCHFSSRFFLSFIQANILSSSWEDAKSCPISGPGCRSYLIGPTKTFPRTIGTTMSLPHPTTMCPEPTILLTTHRRLPFRASFPVFLDSQVLQGLLSIYQNAFGTVSHSNDRNGRVSAE